MKHFGEMLQSEQQIGCFQLLSLSKKQIANNLQKHSIQMLKEKQS